MALDLFSCMKSFVIVAKHGGFSRAASELYVTPPVLTKQIQRLEDYTGQILFERNTRSVKLTESGKIYLSQVKQVLRQVDRAKEVLYNIENEPHGIIRLGIPGVFDYCPFCKILPQFLKLYPKIKLEVINDSLPSGLLTNSLDIIVSELNIADNRLNKDYLGNTDRLLFASKDYIEKYGIPEIPDDLKQHNCLIYTNVAPTHEWIFNNKKFKVSGNYISNSGRNIIAMAVAGIGIIWAAKISVQDEIRAGKLVEISLKNVLSKRDLWVYSLPSFDSNIRLMVNYFKDYFVDPRPKLTHVQR